MVVSACNSRPILFVDGWLPRFATGLRRIAPCWNVTLPRHAVWHGCPKPKHAPRPKTRAEWWAAKLERNKARDRIVIRALRKAGWTVVRVWECDLARKHWPRVARRVGEGVGEVVSSQFTVHSLVTA